MPTVTDKSGIDWSTPKTNLSDELTLSYLEEQNNIKPKEDYPMVWFVGNKAVSFSEIEDLYRVAKIRKEQFEERVRNM